MKYYWILINIALIYLPTLCMTIALILILMKMSHFESKLKEQARSIALSPPNLKGLAIKLVYRRKIMQILFTYLLVSIICWTPLQVTTLTRIVYQGSILGDWYFELIFFSELSVAFSAAMNPIIFGFLSRPYRNLSQIWKLLRRIKRLYKLAVCRNNNNNNSMATTSSNNHGAANYGKLDRLHPLIRQHNQQQQPAQLASLDTANKPATALTNWIYLKQVQQERDSHRRGRAAAASAHLCRGLSPSARPSSFARQHPISRRRRDHREAKTSGNLQQQPRDVANEPPN